MNYVGVSKSSRTDLIMKYMLTFFYWSLLSPSSSLLSSSCNGSSAFATAGTDIIKSHVGWSVIVPEFQTVSWKWHPERTAVWFLGHNSKARFCLLLWPSTGSSGHFWLHPTVPGRQIHMYHCLCSASKSGTNFTEFCCMFRSSLEFTGMFHTRGLTRQLSPKWCFVILCWWFC
jgi:hypothetical protein